MKTVNDLNENTQYWLDKVLRWSDEHWSEESNFVRVPVDQAYLGKRDAPHSIRDSVWYATGLLMRQSDGDVERALQIIQAIMTYQFDDPSTVYHGTFYRTPDEPPPPENPTEWRDYDPNWREFICTVFIILLREFYMLIPSELQTSMKASIQLAAEGSFERKVRAEYTNISLMSAFLLDYAGTTFDKPDWQEYALSQAREIDRLFNRNKTFDEYNSPTYYGVDFYALALWRKYGSSSVYQNLGATMEAELWRDLAQFYHADMKNICGPYDRSYGMDMTEYIAVVGLWMASALPATFAPLPDVDKPFDHAGDYYFVPLVALVDTMPPDDVMPHLTHFQGERYLERTIEPNRSATAWLSNNLMLGAEADKLNPARSDQFHPATAHWKASDGSIGWLRTRSASLIHATAKPHQLLLSADEKTEYVFQIRLTDSHSFHIAATRWTFPGMAIEVERSDTPYSITLDGDLLKIQFASDDEVKLTFEV
jgi:hypothetical protein